MAVGLLFWPVWFTRTYLHQSWVNPYTILLALGLPIQFMVLFGGPIVLLSDGLFEISYQYALLMTNIQTVAQLAGVIFFFRLFRSMRIYRILPFQRIALTCRDLKRAEILFLMIFSVSLYLLARNEFGVVNWLMNPREGYQLYRKGQGHWYAIAVSALGVAYLMGFLAKPKQLSIIVKTILYLALGYLLGTKGVLLSIFCAMLVFLWFIHSKYLGRIIIVGTPIIFTLMLINLYLALADGFDFEAILAYFDHYKNGAAYYRSYLNGEIPLFYGELYVSSFWSYLPRALWEEKPFVYGVLHINEIFFPGMAELTSTPVFGGAVGEFADFGVPGIIFLSFFSSSSVSMAMFSYLIFRRPGLTVDRATLASVLLLLIQFAPGFGQYLPGGLYFLLLVLVLLLIALMRFRIARTEGGLAC